MRAESSPDRPLVSIMICSYNHQDYVRRAIETALVQSYDRTEIVIVDDGSRDRTGAIVDEYAAAHPDKIRAYHQENRGIPKTFNRGVSLSRGELVAIAPSDDYMAPDRIEKQVARFEARPELSVVHTDVMRVTAQGRSIGRAFGRNRPARGSGVAMFLVDDAVIYAPSVMYRRSAILAVGGFDEGLRQEDWPLWLKLAEADHLFDYIDEPLTYWRQTPGSASHEVVTTWRENMRARQRYIEALGPEAAASVRWRELRNYFRQALFQAEYKLAAEIAPHMARAAPSPGAAARVLGLAAAQRAAQIMVPAPAYAALKRAKQSLPSGGAR